MEEKFCLHYEDKMVSTVLDYSSGCLIAILAVANSVQADFIDSKAPRRVRSLGSNMFSGVGGGGMYDMNNVGANDGLRNPDKSQLESIYRGKVIWGNVSEGAAGHDKWVYQSGRDPDVETDKFGNPLNPPPRRGPRPQVKPKKKEDLAEGEVGVGGRRKKRSKDEATVTLPTREKLVDITLNMKNLNEEQLQQIKEIDDKYPLIMKHIDDNMDKSVNTMIEMAKEAKLIRKRDVEIQETHHRVHREKKEIGRRGKRNMPNRDMKIELVNRMKRENKLGNVERCVDDEHAGIEQRLENEARMEQSDHLRMKRENRQNLLEERLENGIENDDPAKNVQNPLNPIQPEMNPVHSVQKRNVPYNNEMAKMPDIKSRIESRNKGLIESRYKGPQIESRYRGAQILSLYQGPQIRSQYQGPQIRSEYKGKVIAMLGGVEGYEQWLKDKEKEVKETPDLNRLWREKYAQMNREMGEEKSQKVMKFVQAKPKVGKIFRDS